MESKLFHPSKRMPEILPSASKGMRVSKEIQEIKPCQKDFNTPKKKVVAMTQRKNPSLVKKVNSKDLLYPKDGQEKRLLWLTTWLGKEGAKENV